MKLTNHQDGNVREAALTSLGVIKGRMGDDFMSPFIKDLNDQKMAKVNTSAETVSISKYDQSKREMEKKKRAEEKAKKAELEKASQEMMNVDMGGDMEVKPVPKKKKKKKGGPPAGFLKRQQERDQKPIEPKPEPVVEETKQPESGSAEPAKERVRVESKNPNMREDDFVSA